MSHYLASCIRCHVAGRKQKATVEIADGDSVRIARYWCPKCQDGLLMKVDDTPPNLRALGDMLKRMGVLRRRY